MNCLKTCSLAKEIGRGRMSFLSALVSLLYFLIFFTVFQTFGGHAPLVDYGFYITIAGLIVILPLHLFLHCLPIWAAGRRAKMGWRRSQWPNFFYSVRNPVSKRLSIIATLTPVVVITAVSLAMAAALPGHTHYIAIISAVNVGLSVYDFFAAKQMMSAPNDALIEENKNGFHVIRATEESVTAFNEPDSMPS
ncbi:DUF3267 domain-containing protein [Alkalicoccus urumqiensis]|uniref:DUF3267 domain-containing protein n=1 Tax=Alkalicoccus urumqiensis TaxID=1548213 RepID=A0A2P6MFB1_ALKUR|nr:DUF3267 domain-containing protein [Alkalicoccus urumqiensis]PRO64985.1 hypothetical protein C6I21_11065 [Alkalicoccus urumqiensis]